MSQPVYVTPTDTISTQEGLGIRPKGLMNIKQCHQDLIPLRSAEQLCARCYLKMISFLLT